MDFRHHRRRPSGDRLLTAFSLSPPSSSAATSAAGDDELSEDDVFFAGADFSTSSFTATTTASPPSFSSLHSKSFKPDKSSFGILAALPESSSSSTTATSIFNHKIPAMATVSPSSSRITIPVAPRHSPVASERKISSLPAKYHQSAPMKVPVMPPVREKEKWRRKGSAFGYEDDKVNGGDGDGHDDDDEDGEMLPPHEIVARQMAKSPVLSCSVLEGAGRTLKGRDLRQVRNAVFRQTGFID